VEYDMDALLGEDHNVETDPRTDDDDHQPESETAQSKRPKRFKVQQVQELEA
jgi:homeobox-leucine zipper protein